MCNPLGGCDVHALHGPHPRLGTALLPAGNWAAQPSTQLSVVCALVRSGSPHIKLCCQYARSSDPCTVM